MTPEDHYHEAELLLEEASETGHSPETVARQLALAEVHALLALYK